MHSMNRLAFLIPSRLNSRRLPRKALERLGDKSLIETVFENTSSAVESLGLNADVLVCTDSTEIKDVLKRRGIPFIGTTSDPVNGTERIAQALRTSEIEYDYIIDVQGDEPFVNKEIINLVWDELKGYSPKEATIILPHQIIDEEEASKSSIVKLVTNGSGHVVYMSRSRVPFGHKLRLTNYKKHLSVIGFTGIALKKYIARPQTWLEKVEDIELLRAMELNIKIVSPRSNSKTFSIDTMEDLVKARALLESPNA